MYLMGANGGVSYKTCYAATFSGIKKRLMFSARVIHKVYNNIANFRRILSVCGAEAIFKSSFSS